MHRPWRTFAALINRGLSGKTSGLDKLRLSRAQILWGMYYQKNVDYVELLWEDFIYQIDNRVYKKQEKIYYPRFMKAVIHHFLIQDKTLSWRNKIRMHTSKDDYLINTLRFVSTKESTQIYGKLLPETLTSLEMKESRLTRLILAMHQKGKQVKRSAKKCITTPATGIVISEAPMETQNKRKEKVDVARGKGIELLSEVALAEKTQMKETKSSVKSEGTGDKPGVLDVTKDDSTEKDEEEVKDDDEEEDEFANTLPNTDDKEDTNLESKNDDNLKEKDNLEITQEQVVEDAHVTILTVAKETEVLDASFSHSSDLASKFLKFLDIHPNDAEIVSPLDVHVHHEIPRTHTSTLLTVPVSVIPEASPDKDEGPSAGSNRGFKKRKTSKDAEPTTGTKSKDSASGSSKGTKSQPKSSGKNDQSKVPEFEVADTDMPQDQGGNLGKTPQKGPTQNWLMTLAASSSTNKSLKSFDELMSTHIDIYAYIMNGLKIFNLTQETLLGLAFRLLKGTRSNYAELEYDFEECYKALLEKLDWENPDGRDYPFDLTKPLPLVKVRNCQKVPADYFFNNDLKYLQGGISTMTYTTSLTNTKAALDDLPGIEDMVPNICSPVKVTIDRYVKWGISHWKAQCDDVADFAIALKMFIRSLVILKRGRDLQLDLESYQKVINVTRPDTRNRLMRSNELYKFSDGTLTRLLTSLEDITKNIHMRYLPKRRWSSLEKKRAHFMIKEINKLLKERRMMQRLEKFIGGRLYDSDPWLFQRTI
nr:hypothetical protein [Tanacetum cinerariifolium]